jgi:uncharacterized protein YndB with AHSA1/START domain
MMFEQLRVSEERGSKSIAMTRIFDAPPSAVFEAWTTPEQVAQWWDPGGKPLAVCEIDLRPGGAFRWVHQGDTKMEYPFTGTYRTIVPPHELVFAAHTTPTSPESIATLRFIEDGERTRFDLSIEFQSIADRDTMLAMHVDVGMARTLENLNAFLGGVGEMGESE